MASKPRIKLTFTCISLILVFGVISSSCLDLQTQVSEVKSKWLHTEGRYIKDSLGNIVYLRGVSKMGLEYTCDGFHIVESDYDLMKEMGVNVVRIPYTMEWIYNPGYLAKIDRQIQWCKERNIYVILDMHRPNHRGQQSFPWNETAWISQWLFLAERYKEEPTVIGFDLFNEPHDVDWVKWKNTAERAAKAIHKVNPNLLILIQGVGWGWDLAGAQTNPVNETNIVYSPHIYPYPLSHAEWSYAYKKGNYELGYQLLRDYIKSNWEPILTNNIAPILVGEFGTPIFEENNLRWMKDLLEIMHELEISYTCWVFYGSDKPRDCALLKSDWKTFQP
ncbi:MAG: glycoside hydrolase family 5 protein, partial [Candidatus Bathyarchaeia archaeon]